MKEPIRCSEKMAALFDAMQDFVVNRDWTIAALMAASSVNGQRYGLRHSYVNPDRYTLTIKETKEELVFDSDFEPCWYVCFKKLEEHDLRLLSRVSGTPMANIRLA